MLDQRYSDNELSKRDIPSFIEPRPPLIQNPFMRPRPQKGMNLLELFEEDSELEEPELVQVYLRLKPCNERSNLYEVRSDRCLVTSLDTATAGHGRRTQHNVSKMYTFSKIFRPDCTQKEIFEQVVRDNLKKLPDGQSFTLLTYGASGSGKTYTLMGTVSSPGLVPRSLEYVFKLVDAAQQPLYKPGEAGAEKLSLAEQDFELQWVKRLRHVSAPLRDKYRRMSTQLHSDMTVSSIDLTNRTRYYVWVSFVEIYNEAIYDLLSPPDKRTKLRIREDSSGHVYVKGVTQAFVRSGEEAYDVMVAGKHNLIVAATGVHAQSSRSHCIFTITMLTEIDGEVRWSMVRLCDLAGCERARATRNTGARMQESRAINSSLHVLERCLHTLRRRQRARNRADALVPYRESKLTRLLGSGLSGARGEAVSMVVTLNPSPEYAHETKHVLTLAAVAQDIQINNTMLTTTLESSTQDTTIESSAEVMRLRSENERLHFELVQAQARNKEMLASMEERQQQAADTMRELVEEAKDITRQYYEAQLQALRTEMEEMAEEYESRLAKSTAPSTEAGTPSRYLQAKVAQLMTEIAVLEEKLTAEHLARSRAEKEVQHLRDCIEERDEKAFKDNNSNNQEVMALSDSDHDSDEENDIFNESLEPIFKKENMNKSHSVHRDDLKQNVSQQIVEEECDKSIDTLKNDSHNDTTKDSAYAGGDDESDYNKISDDLSDSIRHEKSAVDQNNALNEKEGNDSTHEENQDFSLDPINNLVEIDIDGKKDDNDIHAEKDDSTPKKELREVTNEKSVLTASKSDFRGTYCLPDETPSNVVKEDVFKKPSLLRGTYFVNQAVKPSEDTHNKTDVSLTKENGMDMAKTKQDGEKIAKKEKETLVSKIIQSIKSQGSDSSLRQFELLEMEANACEETKNDVPDFGEVRFLKEKRTYFEDNTNLTTNNKVQSNVEKVKQIFENKSKDQSKEMFDIKTDKDKAREQLKKFFDTKIYTDKSKAQPKEFLGININKDESKAHPKEFLDININKDEPKANPKEFLDVNINNDKSRNNPKEFFDTKINSDIPNDDAKQSCEIKRNKEKRTYFDNISINIDAPINKKINDIITQNTDERSPSIVKELVGNDFEPSTIKKLLGESLTKPEFLSSIQKNRIVKKHDSVDIFEDFDSPHINKPMDFKNDFDAVTKSVEKLRLPEVDKVDIKREIKMEAFSSIDTPVIEGCKSQNNLPEIIVNNTPTDTTNVNNTIEEFENLYKDVTQPRATEFELLVSQVSTVETKETDDVKQNEVKSVVKSKETDIVKQNEVKNEPKQIQFEVEETNYKLRNKSQSKSTKTTAFTEQGDEILAESQEKCESKLRTKRSLRLRRRNPVDEEQEVKLKDIVNLQDEFSDVTMDVPAAKKEVKDIPSPEKCAEEENVPPILGIQSCPSKSVTRSRRKLFTPRAEPLEESLTQAGDSNEKIRVPRPSYHRTRARRKL
ncbi:kinesin-like protein KIF20B [Manduca sexta]|uniref:kinesin-like protein KIF20B n=1 Tax=Manduca sexta TaxID=7130 RepID=UPI0018905415|nr:kinesin-like protein KIF20B [Manduca sexta]